MNSQRSTDTNELKRQALNFYTINADIPKRVEDALNSLFYDSPYDVYGYLSEYFTKYTKPMFITKVNASKSVYYDSKSQPTFRLEIFCQDKNKENKLLSVDAPCHNFDLVNDSSKIQLIQEEDAFRSSKINEIISFINTEINDLIKNHSPSDQDEIDDKLNKLIRNKQVKCLESFSASLNHQSEIVTSRSENFEGKKSKTPTSPKQKGKQRKPSQPSNSTGLALGEDLNVILNSSFYPSFVESLVSKSICKCSSLLSNKQLFEHIADLGSNSIESYSMPIPMITLLQNGKGFNGKQNLIKEFILMPKPHLTIQEGVELISKINRHLRDTLYQSKIQPGAVNKCVTDIGSLTCALETPQQGIELIESAILSVCGNEHASNVIMAINIAGSELFDPEKNKYEIGVGLLKSSDELIEVYADLISKFPRITMIIEPFSASDHVAWYKLYMKVSKYCLIANNTKLNDSNSEIHNQHEKSARVDTGRSTDLPKLIEAPKHTPAIQMPVSFYKFENTANVTSIGEQFRQNASKNFLNGLCCSVNENEDTFIADLSVGNQVKFLKIGGFNRSERVSKINRLIEIESFLIENKKLLDPKSELRDLRFSSDLEIPAEYYDAVHSVEEIKTQKPNKK